MGVKRTARVEKISRKRHLRRQGRMVLRGAFLSILFSAAIGGVTYLGWSYVTGKQIDFQAIYARWKAGAFSHGGMVLQHVTVDGRKRTDSKRLQTALGVNVGQPLQELELSALRQRVEALPWVKAASVQRHLPGRLHVVLEERDPLALWQYNGKLLLLDLQGKVVQGVNAEQFSQLPMVVGEGAQKHVHSVLHSLQKSPELFARVLAVVRVAQRRWDVHFDSGAVVMLPEKQAEKSWLKLARYEKENQLLARTIKTIDLRISGRMVLRLPDQEEGDEHVRSGYHNRV